MTNINFPASDSKPDPSFSELIKRASALTTTSSPKVYMELLHGLAAAKLDGIQVGKVLDVIKENLGCSLKTVHNEYVTIKNKLLSTNDVGLIVAKEALTDFYGSGLHLKKTADGCFYFFDGKYWRLTSPDVVRGNIQKIANKYLKETKKGLAGLVSEAMRCLEDILANDDDMLGMTEIMPPVINCQNTEVWLGKDGALEQRPHHPASRLFSCREYEYDPNATCPIFDKTINGIFEKTSNPQDMVRHFEEILGHAISGQRHIALFIMMVGEGNNGKSKLLETFMRLIGEQAVLCDSLATFQKDRFNMAALQGKLMFCDDDLKHGTTLNDEIVKKLSENKIQSARHPYGKKKFNFRTMTLAVIASNDYPNTDDISHGMIRRVHIVPFDRKFTPEEDDKGLFPLIWENEMPGILNRAIQGWLRLNKRGGFQEPEDCVKARHDFLAHANPVYAFLSDFTVKDPDAKMRVKDFKEVLALWAKGQGIPFNKKDKKLLRDLRGLQNTFGYSVTKDASKVAYPMMYGLSLKNEHDSKNDS